ncbi:MAG: hypothetical protein AB1652_00780 [Bacillota bacterium]
MAALFLAGFSAGLAGREVLPDNAPSMAGSYLTTAAAWFAGLEPAWPARLAWAWALPFAGSWAGLGAGILLERRKVGR